MILFLYQSWSLDTWYKLCQITAITIYDSAGFWFFSVPCYFFTILQCTAWWCWNSFIAPQYMTECMMISAVLLHNLNNELYIYTSGLMVFCLAKYIYTLVNIYSSILIIKFVWVIYVILLAHEITCHSILPCLICYNVATQQWKLLYC